MTKDLNHPATPVNGFGSGAPASDPGPCSTPYMKRAGLAPVDVM